MKYASIKILIIGLFAFSMALVACKKQAGEETTTETQTPTAQSPSASAPSQPVATDPAYAGLTSIGMDAMRELWESGDALDIIFYDTNFSLSQTDQEAIRNTLGYFLPSAVAHNTNCKPVGRITFLIKGEIRREADIYIHEGCKYFLWIENTKPAYINPMTPGGVAFFDGIMKKGTSTFQ